MQQNGVDPRLPVRWRSVTGRSVTGADLSRRIRFFRVQPRNETFQTRVTQLSGCLTPMAGPMGAVCQKLALLVTSSQTVNTYSVGPERMRICVKADKTDRVESDWPLLAVFVRLWSLLGGRVSRHFLRSRIS